MSVLAHPSFFPQVLDLRAGHAPRQRVLLQMKSCPPRPPSSQVLDLKVGLTTKQGVLLQINSISCVHLPSRTQSISCARLSS